METTLHRQTKAREYMRTLRLPVKSFFQMTHTREVELIGRDINISTTMIKAFILGYIPTGVGANISVLAEDSTGVNTVCFTVPLTISETDTDATIITQVQTVIADYTSTNLGFTPDSYDWLLTTPPAVAAQVTAALAAVMPAASYQAIVTQTGTSAPTVAGGVNNYPSGTTFTWARSSAGVYTLTASAAVFTSKTSVVLGSLNNLNSSYKAVVTSSTVITLTTAIGSLLGLGLLGLTATNTDALLTQTMVYVQTYS